MSGAAALAFGAGGAAAADRGPMPAKAPLLSPAPVHSWAGLYIGGHAGGIAARFNNNVAQLVAGPAGSSAGIVGGAQVGTNWQVQRLVFGIEADASAIGVRATTAAAAAAAASFEEDWLTTARGRVGYAWQHALLYLTAGVGFTNVEAATVAGSARRVQPGVAAGAGLELALKWPRWTGRIEYLYVDVPKDSYVIGPTRLDGGSDNHIGRVALNYWLW